MIRCSMFPSWSARSLLAPLALLLLLALAIAACSDESVATADSRVPRDAAADIIIFADQRPGADLAQRDATTTDSTQASDRAPLGDLVYVADGLQWGQLIESITGYGRFWNFNADLSYTPAPGNGNTLHSVPRYAAGPCAGHASSGDCTFDTRTFVEKNGTLVESITAYGSYWNFDASTHQPLPGSGNDLTTVPRYATGPCADQAAGNCTFDTRTSAEVDGALVESITAYGRYWNFDASTHQPLPDNGDDLTSVPRYAAGPCAGQAAGSCRFTSRAFVDHRP